MWFSFSLVPRNQQLTPSFSLSVLGDGVVRWCFDCTPTVTKIKTVSCFIVGGDVVKNEIATEEHAKEE